MSDDPDLLAPWDDVEMRFAMMSVVLAARFWHERPDDESTNTLLHQSVALCDRHLKEWEERR